MDLSKVQHMKEGHGQHSYAKNSKMQRIALSLANPSKETAMRRLCKSVQGIRRVGIADFGCSTGPNALLAWQGLVLMLERVRMDHGHHDWVPEYQVYLNDLPSNDFNSIFKALQSQGFEQELSSRCFVNAVPGSFYNRLFPSQTLHFVHSSFSLHWLSQVPKGVEKCNRKSAISVEEAYYQQFQTDFTTFLKCRSEELVTGGCMVLTMLGRNNDDLDRSLLNCFPYLTSLLKVLAQMASEGLIEEEKMETFNWPLYAPSIAELESVVKKEGSFSIIHSQNIIMGSNEDIINPGVEEEVRKAHEMVPSIVGGTRSISYPLIRNHFGEELSIDEVFHRFEAMVRNGMDIRAIRPSVMVSISLTKY